jgi:hypothetical protein
MVSVYPAGAEKSRERFSKHLEQVQRLDLHKVSKEVQRTLGWCTEKAAAVEGLYRTFLALCATYRGEGLSPTKEVDFFWHQHILDTRAYALDCANCFGFFLHHVPAYGEVKIVPARVSVAELRATHGNLMDCLSLEAECSRCGNDSGCSDCRSE